MEPTHQNQIYQPAYPADREESIDIKKHLLKFHTSHIARWDDKTASLGASVNGISFRIPEKEFTYFDWNY
jgi:hypothetical protein